MITSSQDEIGELSETFNQITEAIKSQKTKIEEYSQTLEEKVKEKTAELKKRNMELEQFNKMAVGREVHMVELKRRISELEKDRERRLGNAVSESAVESKKMKRPRGRKKA
ncbi:hypothetical protein JW826_03730 [Candidatus Woesearchaeota archaeon]|nr:hypothetical protein [Candidatus Woesearchaeota archaeon]